MRVLDHDGGSLSALDLRAISHIPPGGNWRDLPLDFPSDRVKQIRRGAEAGTGTRSSYYGRLEWNATAATIATYFVRPGNGANIHPSAPRTLTFREAARLQGFDDRVRFFGSQRARAMQIGNAVPPPVAAAVGAAFPARGFAVELFAGAGGLSAGLHAAGFGLVSAVDFDADALHALASHVDLVDGFRPSRADLSVPAEREEIAATIERRVGAEGVALLAGGPPCQGFSTAGKNELFSDPRNSLPDAYVWFVQRLRPKQILFENVAALVWKSRRPWFDRLRKRLGDLGYETEWRIVHCESFGLPQRRRRLILIGSADRKLQLRFPIGACRILEPAYWKNAQDQRAAPSSPPTVRDAIGDLPEVPSARADIAVPLADDGVQTAFRHYVRGRVTLATFAGIGEASPSLRVRA